ncbi:adenylate kinase [Gloeothece citriformis PCC 7424]|uniref:Adenylate kinase n=1 Tax=Gloeothece citriformis (strain PCC 7424) TaxID=65393 RepID=B7KI06_GLOC7|nr:adenylate kinase [Gloeothece citriformis]ACK72103.1 adenylate kinase [Gloeothece citriformis PCC 7424]
MTKPIGLIFLGPPGSGKGTQAQVLSQSLQIPHISTGDILRQAITDSTPLGIKAQSYMDKGELVPDDLLLDLIKNRLSQPDAQQGWILDGFPRTVAQACFLENLLAQLDLFSECVVNLEVPEDVLIERLLGRGRQDDHETTIRRRLQVYHEQTAPVIDYYRQRGNLNSLNGNRPPEQVSHSLKEIIIS